jgi:hypothetical protein
VPVCFIHAGYGLFKLSFMLTLSIEHNEKYVCARACEASAKGG